MGPQSGSTGPPTRRDGTVLSSLPPALHHQPTPSLSPGEPPSVATPEQGRGREKVGQACSPCSPDAGCAAEKTGGGGVVNY